MSDVRMDAEEVGLLTEHLTGRDLYLEFGCGGSTVLAARCGIPRIVSVESDKAWIEKMREETDSLGAEVTFHHADVGETGDWGVPTDMATAPWWVRYPRDVWGSLNGAVPDVVLIDGRWRVSCALYTVLHCPPSTVIAFHDFWDRESYRCVLNHTDHVASAGTLAVLRPRRDPDYRALALDLGDHLMNPF